jgi:hypothetical protein
MKNARSETPRVAFAIDPRMRTQAAAAVRNHGLVSVNERGEPRGALKRLKRRLEQRQVWTFELPFPRNVGKQFPTGAG